ncbi:MAG: sigma-70 family RNA polymerase sigma factor [Verrucomicrobiales bacterium]|nr:sigma-70 family RNA polymerase sigma factor [Verrucomicrobiales bacterium]
MDSMDTTRLLKEYADQGSEAAFRELVKRYVDFVFSVALRQSGGDRHLAEDIAQTVFTDLARKVSAEDGPLRDASLHLGGWLHRHTCFVGSNVRRADTRRQAREEVALAMSSLHPDPDTDQGWCAVAPCLDEAIQELGPQDREAIILRFYERLDLRRLGRHFGVTDDAAQKRVARALDRLRDRLAAKGIAATAVALAAVLPDRAVQAAPSALVDAIHRAVMVSVGGAAMNSVSTGAPSGVSPGSASLISTRLALALVVVGIVVSVVFFARPLVPSKIVDSGAGGPAAGNLNEAAGKAASAVAVVVPDRSSEEPSILAEGGKPAVLRLTLLADDSGRPLAGVPVDYRGWEGEHFTPRRMESDAVGLCQVPIEAGTIHLELTTRRDGFADTCLEWWPERGQTIPTEYTVRIARPVRIGGVVVDAEGNPVFGAKVGFNHEEIFHGGDVESHRFGWIEAETDITGRWKIDRIHEDVLKRIFGSARHSDHADSALLTVSEDSAVEKLLRSEAHVFRLGRADAVKGSVVDTQDRAIAAARILVGSLGESGSRQGTTDGMGHFLVAGCRPGETVITAEADGFSPRTQRLRVGPETEAQRLVLSPGTLLRLRVLDREGQLVEGAQVWLDTMENRPRHDSDSRPPVQVEFAPKTDSEGRVTWANAPDMELSFDVAKAGYLRTNGFRVYPDGKEHVVTLPAALAIHGSVVDDVTGKAIEQFRIVTGWPQTDPASGVSTPQWNQLERFTMKFEGGEFRHSVEEAAIEGIPNPGYHFRFEAEGYQPFVSRVVKPDEGRVWMPIRLKPVATREVSILRPDGRPAALVEVIAMAAEDRASLKGQRFDPEATSGIVRGNSEGKVRFAIENESQHLVAVHESGFLDLPIAECGDGRTLTLKPWARLEVTVWSRGRPVAEVEMHLAAPDFSAPGLHLDPQSFLAVSDREGRLVFPMVPPVSLQLTRVRDLASAGSTRSWTDVFVKSMEFTPGESVSLELGRNDRSVAMRLIAPSVEAHPIESAILFSTPTPVPPPEIAGDARALLEWRRKPETVSMFRAIRTLPLTRTKDGTWMADNVPPGSYVVRAGTLPPASAPTPGEIVRRFQGPIVVLEGQPENVVDLGEIRLR